MERHLQLRFGSSGKVEVGGELKLATHFGRNRGGEAFLSNLTHYFPSPNRFLF